MGPKVSHIPWKKPSEKFQDRLHNIHSLQLPAAIAKRQFTNRALPILSSVAKFPPPPPKNITRIGLNAIMTSLRLCGDSLSYNAATSLTPVGGLGFLMWLLSSSLIKCVPVLNILQGLDSQHNSLLASATEAFFFASHRYKYAIPLGWDTLAVCTNLLDALKEIQGRGSIPGSLEEGPQGSLNP